MAENTFRAREAKAAERSVDGMPTGDNYPIPRIAQSISTSSIEYMSIAIGAEPRGEIDGPAEGQAVDHEIGIVRAAPT
jgi:hypothetical protein